MIQNIPSKWPKSKVEICLKKPPRAQIFHYFRSKSRNKKLQDTSCASVYRRTHLLLFFSVNTDKAFQATGKENNSAFVY